MPPSPYIPSLTFPNPIALFAPSASPFYQPKREVVTVNINIGRAGSRSSHHHHFPNQVRGPEDLDQLMAAKRNNNGRSDGDHPNKKDSKDGKDGGNDKPSAGDKKQKTGEGERKPSRSDTGQESNGQRGSSSRNDEQDMSERIALRSIADQTLRILDRGAYKFGDQSVHLRPAMVECKTNTKLFQPNMLAGWRAPRREPAYKTPAKVVVSKRSTTEGAQALRMEIGPNPKIGVLNFASATKPGGGFKSGAEAQEESIARSSTLYASLTKDEIYNRFYRYHKHHRDGGYYSHNMIYSPGVMIFRDDKELWGEPVLVDVVTSCAVNAGEVRRNMRTQREVESAHVEQEIRKYMEERMGRILYLFEKHNIGHLILGAFGAGVFQNDVDMVIKIWQELLGKGSRFERSFAEVHFAVIGDTSSGAFESALGGQKGR